MMEEHEEDQHVYEINSRCPHCEQPIFSDQEWTYRYGVEWHEECAIDDDDSEGVREPRHPQPHASGDGVELPRPDDDDEAWESLNRIPLTVIPS
jgi:hypothetical protein